MQVIDSHGFIVCLRLTIYSLTQSLFPAQLKSHQLNECPNNNSFPYLNETILESFDALCPTSPAPTTELPLYPRQPEVSPPTKTTTLASGAKSTDINSRAQEKSAKQRRRCLGFR